jgi:hypothetical protein
MLVSTDNCTWTTRDQILNRVTDEDQPVSAKEPNENAPKGPKNDLEYDHCGFVVG